MDESWALDKRTTRRARVNPLSTIPRYRPDQRDAVGNRGIAADQLAGEVMGGLMAWFARKRIARLGVAGVTVLGVAVTAVVAATTAQAGTTAPDSKDKQ